MGDIGLSSAHKKSFENYEIIILWQDKKDPRGSVSGLSANTNIISTVTKPEVTIERERGGGVGNKKMCLTCAG